MAPTPQPRRLYVVLGSDCDPDRTDDADPIRWEGVRQGIPRAREIARQVESETSVPMRITWCVRSDAQMRALHGDPAWAYREFAELWEKLAAEGDEIAWHPHLWRRDDRAGGWFQETEDGAWMTDCLQAGHGALAKFARLTTCRMGWEFHNDLTLQTVERLGIAYDFSAIPGWYVPATEGRVTATDACVGRLDWRTTPDKPYYPSRADYRRPARAEEEALGLLELPLTTFSSPLWSGMRALRRAARARGMGRFLKLLSPTTWQPLRVKVYAAARPMLFVRLLTAALRKVRAGSGCGLLVTAFHPDELLEAGGGRRDALYSSRYFEQNLRAIISRARALDVEPVFANVRDVGEMLRGESEGRCKD